ncbi:hypothetical protein KY335_03335 [Candidatus Woesearchaeota archaeon]|nr:hypothetical protein [Candidatus Woesearchaeota archaeon]
MATGRTGLKISLCFLASAGVAGGLAYLIGNTDLADVVREIGNLDAVFVKRALGAYAVGGGLAGAVTVPYYAIKAGYEGVFGTNNCNR